MNKASIFREEHGNLTKAKVMSKNTPNCGRTLSKTIISRHWKVLEQQKGFTKSDARAFSVRQAHSLSFRKPFTI